MKSNLGSVAAILLAAGCMYFVEMNSAVTSNPETNSSPLGYSITGLPVQTPRSLSNPAVSKATMAQMLKELEPQAQTFSISSTDSSFLQGRMGTSLVLPDSLFETPSGKIPAGPIQLTLLECYNLSAILAKELSTTSGDQLLETAGMIHISATCNGEKLVIRSGKNYTVKFPRKEKNDYTLFVGERTAGGIMDWRLNKKDGTPVELASSKNSLATSTAFRAKNGRFIEITHSYMLGAVGKITKEDHFTWNLKTGESLNEYYLANANPPLEMVNDFFEKNLSCEITFKVNRDGEIIQTYISQSSYTPWDSQLNDFVKQLPALNISELMPTYTDAHACKLKFGKGFLAPTQTFLTQFREANNWKNGEDLGEVSRHDLFYYAFNTSTLGWINCDRFQSYEPDQLVTVSVVTPFPDSCNFSLVFDDLSMVIKAQRTVNGICFMGVPKGERVTLVGLQCNNGKAGLDMQSFTIGNRGSTVETKLFKPFSAKELDYALSEKRLAI